MRADYTVVAGDPRTLTIELDGVNLVGASGELRVDSLFTTDLTIDESAGEATVTLEAEDTEGVEIRRAYAYAVVVDDLTVRRGLFIVLPQVDAIA
jgi:hypothetical protein